MSIWGKRTFSIDPWDADYGASSQFERFAQDAHELELGLELQVWCAIGATESAGDCAWVFVDGVRRIDARIVSLHDANVVYGLFGSYAVGAVRVQPVDGSARVVHEDVGRLVVVGSGIGDDDPVDVRPGLTYRRVSTPRTDPDGPLDGLQNEMRLAESRVAQSFVREGTLVVADGPLAHKDLGPGVVGYVKRIFDPYLPKDRASFLSSLPALHRTPVFAIHDSSHSRYAWFLRLAKPQRGHAALAGLVRLEVDGSIGIEHAVSLANLTTGMLPTLASKRVHDPRAPQNLVPVGALERHLRHILGDATLIRRAIETRLAEEETHA